MPNIVYNNCVVAGKPENVKTFIKKYCCGNLKNHTLNLDFNKIIPEPMSKKGLDPKYLIDENSYCEVLEDRPWFDWYEWHVDNWGTKWNAYDPQPECEKNTDKVVYTLNFNTAWSAPIPIWDKLKNISQDLGLEITVTACEEFEDFDYEVTFEKGKCTYSDCPDFKKDKKPKTK